MYKYKPGKTTTTTGTGQVGGIGYSGTSTERETGQYEVEYTNVDVQNSDYYAAFFVKAPPFKFGVIYDNLSPELRAELQRNKGVEILIVLYDSPAFYADIMEGDIIVSFNGTEFKSVQHLNDLFDRNAGKEITIGLLRQGEPIQKTLQLNE